jgi:hypothetical protein
LLIPIAAVLLVSAAPAVDVTELLRQGNAAFAREDYVAAVTAFTQVEDLTDDPGLVAYDKAAALYRMALQPENVRQRGRLLRESEQSYRHALEDATGSRRWAALYGLGNSLVQQHQGRGVKTLFDAIACYEQVLAGDAEPQLKEDARHNLELAKLLWAEDRKPPDSQDKPPNDPNESDPPKPRDPPTTRPNQGSEAGMGTPDPHGQRVQAQASPGQQPIQVDQAPPGAKSLPPVPETDEQTLSPDDAKEHLRRAIEEIRREKQEYQRRAAKPPARGVKDW